jgi:hypothetical protein
MTPFLYGINFIRTKEDEHGVLGQSILAISLCSAHAHFYGFRALLRRGLELILEEKKNAQEVVKDLYTILLALDLTEICDLTDLQRRVWRYSIGDGEILKYKTSVMFRQRKFNVSIPLALEEDEIGDERVSLTKLVQKFKNQTMSLFNAILEQKRVLFIGHGISVGELCCYVLATCLMVCPPLKGILKARVFPYQNLNPENCEFVNVPGYITGVVNPIFKTRTDLWDVLCDLDDGTITINPLGERIVSDMQLGAENLYKQVDNQFMDQILSMINSHALKGLNPLYSEDSVRSHFQEYAKRILNMGIGQALFEDEETKKSIEYSNLHRIKLIKLSQTCEEFKELLAKSKGQCTIRGCDVENSIMQLRLCKNLSEEEIISIFQSFLRHIKTEEQIFEFLSYLPEAQGGLYPIAAVLFHSSEAVRMRTVAFLKRLDSLREGSCCISQLNTFLMLTFDRYMRELNHSSDSTSQQ